jgi:hypothetical protein
LVEWYDFLKWLKTWVESKPKKGQWTPTKADAEAILENVKKPKSILLHFSRLPSKIE